MRPKVLFFDNAIVAFEAFHSINNSSSKREPHMALKLYTSILIGWKGDLLRGKRGREWMINIGRSAGKRGGSLPAEESGLLGFVDMESFNLALLWICNQSTTRWAIFALLRLAIVPSMSREVSLLLISICCMACDGVLEMDVLLGSGWISGALSLAVLSCHLWQHFNLFEGEVILKVPLCDGWPRDEQALTYNRSRQFTVRSAYKLVLQAKTSTKDGDALL
ncbi:hypothetical protein M9H77_07837 [Catharanthus roseus]|uniref:Uncharacterized protein n=1 Tax=Catharanthus roseus TaxID=4058 RepID=A0ACC0BWB5_CATRO|nr:hypothetical protein M9H77_07837 [Catharanthus roseus]